MSSLISMTHQYGETWHFACFKPINPWKAVEFLGISLGMDEGNKMKFKPSRMEVFFRWQSLLNWGGGEAAGPGWDYTFLEGLCFCSLGSFRICPWPWKDRWQDVSLIFLNWDTNSNFARKEELLKLGDNQIELVVSICDVAEENFAASADQFISHNSALTALVICVFLVPIYVKWKYAFSPFKPWRI